ncbi:MAG: hypothetical protein ACYC9J_05180 [Sulfuricaulis sp.]
MLITPDSVLYYLILILIIGNIFALGVGMLMLAAPQRLDAVFKISNRWISTRRAMKQLEMPHSTDRVMLRYPRVLGAIMLASAALILIKGAIFISNVSIADGGKLLAQFYRGTKLSSSVAQSLWLSLITIILFGAVLAMVVGLMSLFKLGKLKFWAESANRWISTRQLTKPLDLPHYHLDRLVSDSPRVWGGVITVLALFSAIVLWWFVRRG